MDAITQAAVRFYLHSKQMNTILMFLRSSFSFSDRGWHRAASLVEAIPLHSKAEFICVDAVTNPRRFHKRGTANMKLSTRVLLRVVHNNWEGHINGNFDLAFNVLLVVNAAGLKWIA